jgi:hypothetical protein
MAEPANGSRSAKPRKSRAGLAVLGVILVLAGTGLLFWNEWRSATRVATLVAGERSLLALQPGRVPADAAGRLVHLAGSARPSGAVRDPVFPVVQSALRLDRIVEMYQWRERDEGSGDNRTTRYEQVWAEGRIASERFRERVGRQNPAAPPFASAQFHPVEVLLGVYGVAPELVDLLPATTAVAVPAGSEMVVQGLALRGDGAAFVTSQGGRPAIGDVRVRFRTVQGGDLSVLAGLDGSVLRPWPAPNGGTIALVEPGLRSAREMLGAAYRMNALHTWAIRLAAVLAVFVGLSLLLGQWLRRAKRLGDPKASATAPLALVVALAWTLAVIALAWALFRPLVSVALVVTSMALFGLWRGLAGWWRSSAGTRSSEDGRR